MKKIIPILAIIAILVGVGMFVLQKKDAHVAMEHILPQQALVYVQVDDVQENLQRLSSLPFWQFISNLDYDALLDNGLIDDRTRGIIDLVGNQFTDIIDSPVTKRLFGQEVAFAVYPPKINLSSAVADIKSLNPAIVEDVLSGFVMVTRVDPDVQFAEFASRFFNQFGSKISQSQSEYKGQTIRSVTATDMGVTFGFVRIKDLLVIGVGESAARRSVDVYSGEQPALAQDIQFAQIKSQALDPSYIIGFANFNPITKILKEQGLNLANSLGVNAEGADISQQWDKVINQITGLKALGFSSQLNPLVQFETYVAFDPAQLDSDYGFIYRCPPGENKTLKFIPSNVLAYQWSNCFDLNYYWREIVKELNQTGDSQAKIGEFESKLGMNIARDFLPTFGEEVGGYIDDIQTGGFFPMPKLLLFIEIKDRPKADKLLGLLNNQPMAMFQEESYNGHTIKYMIVPVGQDIEPGYAFLGDYFLLSTTRRLIKSSIDAFEDSSMALSSNPDFKRVDYGLTKNSRMVQFIKIGQVLNKIKGVIEWGDQFMVAQDEKAKAFKAGGTKPLEEVQANVDALTSELEAMRNKMIQLEDEVWNLESKGEDATAQQTEMTQLTELIGEIEDQLIVENERLVGLSNVVEELDKGGVEPEKRRALIDEIVYPLIDSLGAVSSIGVRSTVENNVLETSIIMDMGL